MKNIFEILPSNFFYIFNRNREVFSDCLFTIYESIKEDNSFTMLKDNFLFDLTQYFNSHVVTLEDNNATTSKEKAQHVYERLKECGWITEEIGENYNANVTFEDYSLTIMDTLFNLDKEKEIEYSSMIYSIYSALNNFDIENGDKILDAQYNMTKELMLKLRNLNTNIKKYIKKLVRENMKNNLEELLNTLVNDYQLKVVDRAFYNLTTRDHPAKYKNKIISKLISLRQNDDYCDTIVRNIMASKDIDYESAYMIFDTQTLYMIDSFENIMTLISEITRKNEKFVTSATNRIMFLLSVKEDISGKINEIIKISQHRPEILKEVAMFSLNEMLDMKSLHTPIHRRKSEETELILDRELDEEVKRKAIEKYRQNEKYTMRFIERTVLSELIEKGEISGSKYLVKVNDISIFVLTWLYGFNKNIKYQIEILDNVVKVQNYKFREFKIKKKEKKA